MKIWTLMENTALNEDFVYEHGLSLYIETARHKILFDAGQTDGFAANAEKLGVDLSAVDIAVLSHGHYDHGGGLAAFLERNQRAPIYMSRYAFEPHFNAAGRDIGLDEALRCWDRLIFTEDTLVIDEELTLYSCNDRVRQYDMLTSGLQMLENGVPVPEDFRHEQYLCIRQQDRRVLISGCSHKGILNIVQWFQPEVLVGGFHFMKLSTTGEDGAFITDAAKRLCTYPTRYYTGHCTGQEQYALLKSVMGQQLQRLTAGSVITL